MRKGGGVVPASTIALQERGCHDDGDQEGEGGGAQRDARSGRGGRVGRTAVGARGHGGGGVGVGGGVSPRCGFCAVLGDYLLEDKEEEEDGGVRVRRVQKLSSHSLRRSELNHKALHEEIH